MTFKNQAEIFQALIDGKKIWHKDWPGGYIQIIDGLTCDELGAGYYSDFAHPENWQLYQPPEPEKREPREYWVWDKNNKGKKLDILPGDAKVAEIDWIRVREVVEVIPEPKAEKKTKTLYRAKVIRAFGENYFTSNGWYESKEESNKHRAKDEDVLEWETTEIEIDE